VSGATGVVLVNEVVDELLTGWIALDEFAEETMGLVDDSEATLELRLLLSVGAGEETDELE
jgi:hypothetical protein